MIRPLWLNDWLFVYELSGCGFESSCNHLNFRFRACFEQGRLFTPVNNYFGNLRAAMKGFLLKSLKNTSEQAHFYQHCKPVNCALTKKWSSLLEFCKAFLIIHVLFGTPPNGCFCTQPRRCKKNIVNEIDYSTVHFLVNAILFLQNTLICSRGMNRLIISIFQGLTKIVVNQSLNDSCS